jgi:hypothetical protein
MGPMTPAAFLWASDGGNGLGIIMKEINFSQVDALFSNGLYPIGFLFYYKEGFKTEKVRRALRCLSSTFWPMFGEYKGASSFLTDIVKMIAMPRKSSAKS